MFCSRAACFEYPLPAPQNIDARPLPLYRRCGERSALPAAAVDTVTLIAETRTKFVRLVSRLVAAGAACRGDGLRSGQSILENTLPASRRSARTQLEW